MKKPALTLAKLLVQPIWKVSCSSFIQLFQLSVLIPDIVPIMYIRGVKFICPHRLDEGHWDGLQAEQGPTPV